MFARTIKLSFFNAFTDKIELFKCDMVLLYDKVDLFIRIFPSTT
ncbi:hypothetical protein C942_02681 [Photobacterium marinum]|uniref:Uncharacterized protein n=1 Tax=Photobacterium marinum TaxID=1056511 RepID=L8JFY2_9GAMM|nr:hypothetical protein C942_02681 [Photobacterium marinum]